MAGCTTATNDDWDVESDGKADGGHALSYGELAAQKTPPAFGVVTTGLRVLDADVLPHEAKAVRKQIAELRDYVDLFVFAYTTKGGDPWNDIRDELDTGYETIGSFKDLFDRQGIEDPSMAVYDPAELSELRQQVLAWNTSFAEHEADTHDYLVDPSPTKLWGRDREKLSPYFWGATKISPTNSKSGLKNMAKLTRELLDLSIADYDDVLDLRDIHIPKNQEKFHSFRKRIRSISRMPGYFPPIMDPGDDVTDDLALITDAVDRYGTLNDKISKYTHDPDKDLEDEIRADWRTLRDWQKQNRFDKVLDRVHDAVRN